MCVRTGERLADECKKCSELAETLTDAQSRTVLMRSRNSRQNLEKLARHRKKSLHLVFRKYL